MLVCMGRHVSFDLAGKRKLDAPTRAGMLHDAAGRYWPSCSLLIARFEQGTEESHLGAAYFGQGAIVYQGHVELPPKSLDEWREIGRVTQVFYERAGTKHPGYYKHKFNAPKGVARLVALFKQDVARADVILYQLGDYLRLELPRGCVVDDRGIVLP